LARNEYYGRRCDVSNDGALAGQRFVPGGRILAAAGQADRRTMPNCLVLGTVEERPERLKG